MMDWLWSFVWSSVPLWVWVIIAGILLGAAWRTFGLHGVGGGLIALLTLGAYRQGWRDRDADKAPMVPVEDFERPIAREPTQPRKRKTVLDIWNEMRERS